MSNILPKSSQARKKTPPDTLGFEHRYCLGNRRWKAALVWKNKQGVYNVQFYSHETILSAIRQPCGSESGDSPNREHYKYEGLTPFPAMRQRCGFFFILFFFIAPWNDSCRCRAEISYFLFSTFADTAFAITSLSHHRYGIVP